MKQLLLIGLIGLTSTYKVMCQASIFTVFANQADEAERSFFEGDYPQAIEHYTSILRKNPSNKPAQLNLARSYYQLKQYQQAINSYDEYMNGDKRSLPIKDVYDYAEAQLTQKKYSTALTYYKLLLEADPDNHIVEQKIWRINNIQYLFEDSTHYAVRELPVNTRAGELCAIPTQQGLIFLSNRARNTMEDHTNKKMNMPFYEHYQVNIATDSITGVKKVKGKPSSFSAGSRSRFNCGPMALYNNGTQMVYVATSDDQTETGDRTLGLYFSIKENNKWKQGSPFIHNSLDYSIYDVTMNEDGTKLFFSSNMKGGKGGKDIYSSTWKDGQWSKPQNLSFLASRGSFVLFIRWTSWPWRT
jgi:hypothetical protein